MMCAAVWPFTNGFGRLGVRAGTARSRLLTQFLGSDRVVTETKPKCEGVDCSALGQNRNAAALSECVAWCQTRAVTRPGAACIACAMPTSHAAGICSDTVGDTWGLLMRPFVQVKDEAADPDMPVAAALPSACRYSVIMLGHTGTVFEPFTRYLKPFRLPVQDVRTLMHDLHDHAVQTAHAIVIVRRRLEHSACNNDCTPPDPP